MLNASAQHGGLAAAERRDADRDVRAVCELRTERTPPNGAQHVSRITPEPQAAPLCRRHRRHRARRILLCQGVLKIIHRGGVDDERGGERLAVLDNGLHQRGTPHADDGNGSGRRYGRRRGGGGAVDLCAKCDELAAHFTERRRRLEGSGSGSEGRRCRCRCRALRFCFLRRELFIARHREAEIKSFRSGHGLPPRDRVARVLLRSGGLRKEQLEALLHLQDLVIAWETLHRRLFIFVLLLPPPSPRRCHRHCRSRREQRGEVSGG